MARSYHAAEMDPRTGRTFWDFLHDLVRSPRAMSMIAASLLLAVGTLWYVVHTHAEPGTPISLVGMIQYQKAKSPDKPVDVGAISSAQTDEIRSLKTRIVDLLRIPTVERRTLTSQVDKLTKDIGERDRQARGELCTFLCVSAPAGSRRDQR